MRVLVVDDDSAVRRSLSTALGRDGYEVLPAEGGNAALDHLVAASVDAIVLDVAMPEPNGLEVCRRLRARGDRTPILMLTARDLVDDRVAGLDAGADDYLAKPFALAELRARLRALLRRNAASAEQLSYADLVLDLAAARVTRGEREVALTRTEYLLLELFL
ncbi:MAG TPA: response regulator transcription factor, partial [Streptosporangiaceae bacterium]|nr:response regulator transcription factor [Streptosporangiaceae bacterium]